MPKNKPIQFNNKKIQQKRYRKIQKSRRNVLVSEFSLKDKFGDYGITGLSIIKTKKKMRLI